MIYYAAERPVIGIRRAIRPILLTIITLLAASICVLGTVNLFAPVLVGA
jgi:hypothetical protein